MKIEPKTEKGSRGEKKRGSIPPFPLSLFLPLTTVTLAALALLLLPLRAPAPVGPGPGGVFIPGGGGGTSASSVTNIASALDGSIQVIHNLVATPYSRIDVAASNALAGDLIRVVGGYHYHTNGVWLLPGVNLEGIGQPVICNMGSNASFNLIVSRDHRISGVTLTNFYHTLYTILSIGCDTTGPTAGWAVTPTNITLENVRSPYSISDGLFFSFTNACSATIRDCSFGAKYDAMVFYVRGSSTGSLNLTIEGTTAICNSNSVNLSYVSGTPLALTGTLQANVRVQNCCFIQTNGLANGSGAIYWNNNNGDPAAFVNLEAVNSILTGTNYLNFNDAYASTFKLSNCKLTGGVASSIGDFTGGTLTVNSLVSDVFTGNGGGLTNLNAANLASGTVPTARLASPLISTGLVVYPSSGVSPLRVTNGFVLANRSTTGTHGTDDRYFWDVEAIFTPSAGNLSDQYSTLAAYATIDAATGKVDEAAAIFTTLDVENTNASNKGSAVIGHWKTGAATVAAANTLAAFRTSMDHNSTGTVSKAYGYWVPQLDIGAANGTVTTTVGVQVDNLDTDRAHKPNVIGFRATGAGMSNVFDGKTYFGNGIDVTAGNVSIGTNTGSTKQVDIQPAANAVATLGLRSTGNGGSRISFGTSGSYGASIEHAQEAGGAMTFKTGSETASANTRIFISSAGNVGFGTTTPNTTATPSVTLSSNLFVGGSLWVTNSLSATTNIANFGADSINGLVLGTRYTNGAARRWVSLSVSINPSATVPSFCTLYAENSTQTNQTSTGAPANATSIGAITNNISMLVEPNRFYGTTTNGLEALLYSNELDF